VTFPRFRTTHITYFATTIMNYGASIYTIVANILDAFVVSDDDDTADTKSGVAIYEQQHS